MKKPTLRKCVGCKEMKEESQLIRITCNKEGEVAIDKQGKRKLPGRGAYICHNEKCKELAQKTKGLERSFKRAIPQEIYEQLVTVY